MQSISELQHAIESLSSDNVPDLLVNYKRDHLLELVTKTLALLESGVLRAAQKTEGTWVVNAWVKRAILLGFKLCENRMMWNAYDKIALKFENWTNEDFASNQIRVVPGATIRYGTYIGKNCIVMPSFVNIGAYIGDGTLVDSNATVGSCAQIGKNCHISANVAVCGVLEPLQDAPVIIEDNCFIGAGSNIGEGVVIGEHSVIAMGLNLSASTKIVNRQTKEVSYGKVPPYSVVVAGSLESNGVYLNCAVIVKQVDAGTRSKTSINQLLRDSG